MIKDDLLVVIDRISGEGEHLARLHWLGGGFHHVHDPVEGSLTLATPEGPFFVRVLDEDGRPSSSSVARGQEHPFPRGWLSRYYGEKVPVPSLAVEARVQLPLTWVSLLGGGRSPQAQVEDRRWRVMFGETMLEFVLAEGLPQQIAVSRVS